MKNLCIGDLMKRRVRAGVDVVAASQLRVYLFTRETFCQPVAGRPAHGKLIPVRPNALGFIVELPSGNGTLAGDLPKDHATFFVDGNFVIDVVADWDRVEVAP